MRVLITGASGFIGRSVLKNFTEQAVETIAVGRKCPDEYIEEFIESDLLKYEQAEKVIQRVRPSHLLHLAWYTDHGEYWSSKINFQWIEATLRIVRAFCEFGGTHVIAAGTCAEYDWNYGLMEEDKTPINPTSIYGISKDATRRIIFAMCSKYNIPCAWGRIFFPYGPNENKLKLIPSLIEVFEGRRDPFGVNGNAIRDYIHVDDVAKAFQLMLMNNAHGCYNISSANPISISRIVQLLASSRNSNPDLILQMESDRSSEPHFIVGTNEKLKNLGWSILKPIEAQLI